ncbi:MAG: hypothetical protein SVX43_11370, partial [Cyanobacteriota bacterium]|nr:hypothetical protein [Cyanobacteriota bacterium]
TLNNPYPYNSENFGFSLAGLGNYALVGSWREHAKNYFAGAVYVYDAAPNSPTLGQLVGAFVSPNPTIYGSFGTSLAVAGSNVLIGAIGENAGAGAAYIYGPQSVSNLTQSQGTAIAQAALLQPEVSTVRQLSADPRATSMPEPAAVPAFFVLGAGGVWLGRKSARIKRLVDRQG